MNMDSSVPKSSRKNSRDMTREEKQARKKQLLAELAALDDSISGDDNSDSMSTAASADEAPVSEFSRFPRFASYESLSSMWEQQAPIDSVSELEERVTIGIGGGVGPMAGCMLHKIIIENTIASGDADHLNVIHLSASSQVPDRTAFLEGRIKENPGLGMAQVVNSIAQCGDACGGRVVVGVPCNTFHSPQIWDTFEASVSSASNCETMHMLQETGNFIQDIVPGVRKVGLMSTTGTRRTGVYRDVLEPHGLEVVEVPETMQEELHEAIYNPTWGIKAVSPVTEQARQRFISYVQVLADLGAEAIILGCTEIPLALPEKYMFGVPLVNPMVALGRALVAAAAPEKLKPLDVVSAR